jgi:iron complex transport system permease protein
MHLDMNATPEPEHYLRYIRRKGLFIAGSTIFLIFLFFMAIAVGSSFIPLTDVISGFLSPSGGNTSTIVMNIRLPRVLAAVIAGAGLAAAGVVMQSVLRNPLSSPYTLGISHAAAFGAAFAITVFGAGSLSHLISDSVVVRNPYLVTICAFFGAMIATASLLLVARYRSSQPEVMILVGVALAALFTAGTTFLQYFSSADQIAAIVFWTFGDVGRPTWSDLILIAAIVIPSLIYFVISRWDYNAIDAGDETAHSLGVHVERVRTVGMLLSSLITAVIISFLGIIGFIGLVSPHMVRRIIGGDQRYLLPASCITGAILLLGADMVARLIITPAVLPVGVLTAFLGAPLFIYLLIGRNIS